MPSYFGEADLPEDIATILTGKYGKGQERKAVLSQGFAVVTRNINQLSREGSGLIGSMNTVGVERELFRITDSDLNFRNIRDAVGVEVFLPHGAIFPAVRF